MNGKAIQFGAGNIGRGFLAQLFTLSGYRVVFVEVDEGIIEQLNRRKEYTLKIVGTNPRSVRITNVSAVNAADKEKVREEMAGADIAATAVGADALPKIAPLIARGISARAEAGAGAFNIIICENLLHAGTFLKNEVKKHLNAEHLDYLENYVGFVESVVSRMMPILPQEAKRGDPLLVTAEEYEVLPVSEGSFKGKIPAIKGFLPTKNFTAYEERKLFIHNLAHAVCAYKGFEKGLKYIWETVLDPEINSMLSKALEESSRALIRKHGFTTEEMEGHIKDLIKRFGNRELGDTVARVGRDPVRKLGAGDRLTGAAKNCIEQGVEPVYIVKGIVAALKYCSAEDGQSLKLRDLLNDKGLEFVLSEVCGIKEHEEKLKSMIKEEWEEEKQD